MKNPDPKIAAVVLAAGLSSRMGSPKMLLKWKDSTVLETVLDTVSKGHFSEVVLVYGAFKNEILRLADPFRLQSVYNPDFADGSMLHSLQAGLRSLSENLQGFMIILGDQPLLSNEIIEKLASDFQRTNAFVVIPSYRIRRGHPWLINTALKNEILAIKEPGTLRDFLNNHESDIHYTVVDDPGILKDLDTPEDYKRLLSGE